MTEHQGNHSTEKIARSHLQRSDDQVIDHQGMLKELSDKVAQSGDTLGREAAILEGAKRLDISSDEYRHICEGFALAKLDELRDGFEKNFDLQQANDTFKLEKNIIQESQRFSISLSEYRRLYELWLLTKKTNPFQRFWRCFTGDNRKSPWELVQLIFLPIVLVFITGVVQYLISNQANSLKRMESWNSYFIGREKDISQYFDAMTELMMTRTPETSNAASQLAEARTIKILTELNQPGIPTDRDYSYRVFQFLAKANLLAKANQSVEEQDGLKISFKDFSLSGRTLDKLDLSNTDLSGVDLSNSSLADINLSSANLEGADLSNANLTRANLEGANLRDAKLPNANLIDAKLEGTHLENANLSNAIVDLRTVRADFCGAKLPQGNLYSGSECPRYLFPNYSPSYSASVVEGASVYSGPGFYYQKLNQLKIGIVLELSGRIEYRDGYSWSQLEGGGWILTNRLTSYLQR